MPLEPEPLLQFFGFRHLPAPLQDVSKAFARLAIEMVQLLPRNPERTTMLRKLLESKDCAVRARIFREFTEGDAGVLEHDTGAGHAG